MAFANHEQDIRILEHAQAIILERMGPMAKQSKAATDRLAASQSEADLHRKEFKAVVEKFFALKRRVEQLDVQVAQAKAGISESLVRIRDQKRAEAEQIEQALRYGRCIIERPPGSGQDTIVVDERFRNILRANNENQITFTMTPVHGVSLKDLSRLPGSLRYSRPPRHGAIFYSSSGVPCPNKGIFVYIIRDDMSGAWEIPTLDEEEEYEIFSVRNGGVLCYSGTFVELTGSFACNEDVVDELPELFDDNVVSKIEPRTNAPRIPEIRLQWHNEDNGFRFRVFQYKRFNHGFLSDIRKFVRTSEQEKTARRVARQPAVRTTGQRASEPRAGTQTAA